MHLPTIHINFIECCRRLRSWAQPLARVALAIYGLFLALSISLLVPSPSKADLEADELPTSVAPALALPAVTVHPGGISPSPMSIPPPAEGSIFRIRISDLRPGQGSIGGNQVDATTEKLMAMTDEKLDRHLKKKPVPLIKLPNGSFMMLDKHHLTVAAARIFRISTYAYVAIDLSHRKDLQDNLRLSRYLQSNGLVRLADSNGRPLRHIGELPFNVLDMTTDPYRDLAKRLVKEGVIAKTNGVASEFAWADFFRKKIPRSQLADTQGKLLDSAVTNASSIARTAQASALPGFTGPSRPSQASLANQAIGKLGMVSTVSSLVALGLNDHIGATVNRQECVSSALNQSRTFIDYILSLDPDQINIISLDCYRHGRTPDYQHHKNRLLKETLGNNGTLSCRADKKLSVRHSNGTTSVVQFEDSQIAKPSSITTQKTANASSDTPHLSYVKADASWKVMTLRQGTPVYLDTIAGFSARFECAQKTCSNEFLFGRLGMIDELTDRTRPFGEIEYNSIQPMVESFMRTRALIALAQMNFSSFEYLCSYLGANWETAQAFPDGSAQTPVSESISK